MLSNQPDGSATFSYTYPGDAGLDSPEDFTIRNTEFIQHAELVEWGLCVDASKTKSKLAQQVRDTLDQRDVYFIAPKPRTKLMFRKTGRPEWVN
jgi:hypothetical protein